MRLYGLHCDLVYNSEDRSFANPKFCFLKSHFPYSRDFFQNCTNLVSFTFVTSFDLGLKIAQFSIPFFSCKTGKKIVSASIIKVSIALTV